MQRPAVCFLVACLVTVVARATELAAELLVAAFLLESLSTRLTGIILASAIFTHVAHFATVVTLALEDSSREEPLFSIYGLAAFFLTGCIVFLVHLL